MISKDVDLIAEAYLSASKKMFNTPPEAAMSSVAAVNPEVTDISNMEVDEPSIEVSIPDMCHADDAAHEESEEHWMLRSNLFSIFTNAKKLHNLAQSGIDLEPWAQQKIAVCTDNLEAVIKYAALEAAENGIEV